MASARVQRWALTLSAYNYTVQYVPGKDNSNADGVSRLPLPVQPREVPMPQELVYLLEGLEISPVTVDQIRSWTDRDPVLSKVRRFVQHGWPRTFDSVLQPYHSRQLELSIQDNCLLWGNRVVVPKQGREKLLALLHEGHPGISKMKGLARSYVWWPNIDADLEAQVKQCNQCQANQPSPPAVPMHPWEWPEHPWERIHLDYAGPFLGKMFLVVVDAHSKWMEIEVVNTATTQATVEQLRAMFARFGLPKVIVTDNGTCFTSSEFTEFTRRNHIRHFKTAPYHPSSNGLAERAVQTFKQGMKKQLTGTVVTKLSRFLFHYRLTPHTTTGIAPAELMLKQRPRSHLDLIIPSLKDKVSQQQQNQKSQHDRTTRQRTFQQDDLVMVRSFKGPKNSWLPATVVSTSGGQSYKIKLTDGKIVRRHADHIQPRQSDCIPAPEDDSDDIPIPVSQQPPASGSATIELRRSQRYRRPPERFQT